LNLFKELKEQDINFICDSVYKRNYVLYQKDRVMEQIRENEAKYNFKYEDQELENILTRYKRDNKEHLAGEFRSVKSLLSNLSEEQFNSLARQLAYPRGQRVHDQATYQTYLRAKKLVGLLHSLGKNNLDLLGLDLNSVKNYFVGSLGKSFGKYLKTPSVIVTYNDMITTGGHNLSSKISRVNSMQHYKRDYGGGRYEDSGERYTDSGERQPTTKNEQPPTASEKPKSTTPSQPQASKPKVTTTTVTPNTASVPKPAAPQNIRPRTEVVSGGARPQRGL
jgi:hypothetical protein